jgi:hypothetical protein
MNGRLPEAMMSAEDHLIAFLPAGYSTSFLALVMETDWDR